MVDINGALLSAQQTIRNGGRSSITGQQSVKNNFDTFLSLLTTQLKNQDPTKPLDTNEFTQQLIQYSDVEQLLQSNQKLEALLKLSSVNTSMSLINYVGKEITGKGNTTSLPAEGSARWELDVPSGVSGMTYVVKDSNGNEVYSTTGSPEAGSRSFTWDGTTSSGGRAPAGNYSLTVNATDASENAVNVGISVKGIVDGVDMSGETPVLLVNGTAFNINDVSQIHTVPRSTGS